MSEYELRPSVVVGVDGSEQARHAVAYAAEEALRRKAPLRIVHASLWPYGDLRVRPSYAGDIGRVAGDLRAAAERILVEAAAVARDVAPGVQVSTMRALEGPSHVLLEQARDAELLVVGNRGLGGFPGLLAGSVSVQVAAHASCPVLVVRGHEAGAMPQDAPVVVAVQESPADAPALEFAFREADRRGRHLLAVHAWMFPTSVERGTLRPAAYDRERYADEEARALGEALVGYRETYPDVTVFERPVTGHPGKAVIDASAGAELLVVGSRGRGGFRGLLLGSVSQAAIHHAHCPVAVVRSSVIPQVR